jgi:biopolymer transport protein ExbB/TolQ
MLHFPIVMLCDILLNVFMVNVVMLSVVMLTVIGKMLLRVTIALTRGDQWQRKKQSNAMYQNS